MSRCRIERDQKRQWVVVSGRRCRVVMAKRSSRRRPNDGDDALAASAKYFAYTTTPASLTSHLSFVHQLQRSHLVFRGDELKDAEAYTSKPSIVRSTVKYAPDSFSLTVRVLPAPLPRHVRPHPTYLRQAHSQAHTVTGDLPAHTFCQRDYRIFTDLWSIVIIVHRVYNHTRLSLRYLTPPRS